jgi:hypothetical protein
VAVRSPEAGPELRNALLGKGCQLEKIADALEAFDAKWGPFLKVPDAFCTVFLPPSAARVEPAVSYSPDEVAKIASVAGDAVAAAVGEGKVSSLDGETQSLVRSLVGR